MNEYKTAMESSRNLLSELKASWARSKDAPRPELDEGTVKIVLAAIAYMGGSAGAAVSSRYAFESKAPFLKRPGLWWFLGSTALMIQGATVLKREVQTPKLTIIEFPDTEELFGPTDEVGEPGDHLRIGEDGQVQIERVEDVQGKVGTLEEGL